MSVLVAAETWGTPPWALLDQPGSLRWLARFGALQELRTFAATGGSAGTSDDFEGF